MTAWRAAFPATLLSLLAFVACRGATGDALPILPAPRSSAPPVVSSIAICPAAAPVLTPPADSTAGPGPSADPRPSVDPGPWISTLPRDAKRLGSHVRCGTTRCEGDTPVCCADERWPRCIPASAPCDASPLECMSASDCGAGRVCCVGVGTVTRCAATCSDGDTPACLTDDDCRGVRIPFVEGKSVAASRCSRRPLVTVRSCAPARE